MPDRSARASRPWSMTFRVTGEPRCPGCCVVLASMVITFHEGWAWCPVCSVLALYNQVHLRFIMHHDVMLQSAVMSHGLRFYLPRPHDGRLLNAIDEYERLINEPEPDRAAIAAWPGFDLVQLPQSVRNRDRLLPLHYRREIKLPFGYEIAGIANDGRTVLIEIKSDPYAAADTDDIPTNSDGNRE